MKAWRLQRLGGDLSLQDIPVPEPRAGSVLIRMHAAALVSYLRNYVQGTLVVTGATGAFGTAAVLLGVALGASRVVAAGRRPGALEAVAHAGGSRVTTVVLKGDIQADARALREAAGGGAHLAFDMVGQARDPNATLAALHSLGRGGRLVLMGSMSSDLPIPYTQLMLNNWEILGQFMYPPDAYRRLLGLVRSGMLDTSVLRPLEYSLPDLPAAMDAAATATNFECAVVKVQH